MAIVVPALVVIGIALLMQGVFRVLWNSTADRIIGLFLIALSVASLSLGVFATLSMLRQANDAKSAAMFHAARPV